MKAILSILLSGYFLVGNLHLNLGTHICGGHAVKSELMVGHSSLSCGMAEVDNACESRPVGIGGAVDEQECCRDIFKAVHLEDEYNKRIKGDYSLLNYFQITRYSSAIVSNTILLSRNLCSDRAPPLILRDEQVLFQTFLI